MTRFGRLLQAKCFHQSDGISDTGMWWLPTYVRRVFDIHVRQPLQVVKAKQEDILALQHLRPLMNSYIPWTSSSMRPSAVAMVLNEILLNSRSTIVECGGGVTTVLIGKLLRRIGGHLYTIEHDKEWMEWLLQRIKEESLDDRVDVVLAPLATTPLSLDDSPWYDEDILKSTLQNVQIDLLIVDGPPAYAQDRQYARYPAGPFFYPLMSKDFAIILDDVHREGEQFVVTKWEQLLDVQFEFRRANIAIARSSSSFNIAL